MAEWQEEKSIGALFSELTSQTATLVRQEIQLARVEPSPKAAQAGKDIGLIGLGGTIAHAGFLAVLAAVLLALGEVVPLWLTDAPRRYALLERLWHSKIGVVAHPYFNSTINVNV